MAADRQAAKEMVQKTKQMGVPVIMFGDDFVVGFNAGKIETLIAKVNEAGKTEKPTS